jgi:hypothetical protein
MGQVFVFGISSGGDSLMSTCEIDIQSGPKIKNAFSGRESSEQNIQNLKM